MKKNLLLTILLVFLVVMNGVLLFLILEKPQKRSRPSRDFMVNELQLTSEQTHEFYLLEEGHRKRMRAIDGQLRHLRNRLFSNAQNPDFAESERDSLVSMIGQLSKKKDLEVFRHFKNIGDLCEPEQRGKLEEIMRKAVGRGPHKGGHPPPGGPPPRD